MFFEAEITKALGDHDVTDVALTQVGAGALPSVYDVTGLAAASMAAAGREFAALSGLPAMQVDRRLASLWFDMTTRPQGWELPAAWDALAGDYRAADGWIRLHTNAPHHRAAAIRALGCDETRAAVSQTVGAWAKDDLEAAVVAQGGCAAALYTRAQWAAHPQGVAVAAEPLIAWQHWDAPKGALSPQSLKGLRVLDLTRILAGPMATRMLAGFGADVLRLDPPDWEEPSLEAEVTLGKRCAPIDLDSAEGRATFETLLKGADILIHGYRPGALAGKGFGDAERRAINPGLSEVALCAYGWTGPLAERRGFDSLVQMSSGIAAAGMAATGADKPVPLPVQALDHATGYLVAAAALRAIRLRRDHGQVSAARLSLARTAELLCAGPAGDLSAKLAPETPADWMEGVENTPWGQAHRVAFPITFEGFTPHWSIAPGPLKRDPATWG